jgi:hypothetical protein
LIDGLQQFLGKLDGQRAFVVAGRVVVFRTDVRCIIAEKTQFVGCVEQFLGDDDVRAQGSQSLLEVSSGRLLASSSTRLTISADAR